MTQPIPTPNPRTLVVRPEDAQEYLARLGLTVDVVESAVRKGEVRAMEASETEFPRTGAGLTRWIETVGALRRTLIGADWTVEDPQNRPICVDRERNINLGVLGGTEATGDVDSEIGPKAQRRKGSATEAALAGQATLYLRADLVGAPTGRELKDAPPIGSWFLVYHRGETGIQIEVSYPFGLKDGQITGWAVRVVLAPLEPESVDESPNDVGGGDVGFDVLES